MTITIYKTNFMKSSFSLDPKKELKPNENPTNVPADLLNNQERGNNEAPNDKQEDSQLIIKQKDFGSEDAEKQIITNNPDEKDEIF